jgi:hypothetical protein
MSIAQDVSPSPVPFDIHRHIRVRRGLGREIAQVCRITPEAVWLWRRVPTWHLEAVSRLLNIPIGVLRPDLGGFVGRSRPLPQYMLTPVQGTPRRCKSTSSPSGHELACGCRRVPPFGRLCRTGTALLAAASLAESFADSAPEDRTLDRIASLCRDALARHLNAPFEATESLNCDPATNAEIAGVDRLPQIRAEAV